MGIRVHKDIGYYLAKKNLRSVLVDNYDEVLDEMDSLDQKFQEKMLHEFEVLTATYNPIAFNYAKIQLTQLLKDKKNLILNQFIKPIYNYDTFKGVLFQTPELAESSRSDDLIDYYELVSNPVFKLNLLKEPLYPDSYYMCVELPKFTKNAREIFAQEYPNKPTLEVGDLISADKLRYVMLFNNIEKSQDRVNVWAYPESNKGNSDGRKYFHPYINVITYLAGRVAGIIKPDVSYLQFTQYLEPAIITHWG